MNAGSADPAAVHAWLSERGEAMDDTVRELARLESPSDDPESQRPVFDRLRQELAKAGLVTRHKPGRRTAGLIYARPAHRKRHAPIQLLLGHTDTVWARDTLQTMPLVEDGNRLRGPGVYDMKAGLVQMAFALRCLKELDVSWPVQPVVVVNSDEEIGSGETRPTIERIARLADRALVLEPSLGQAGCLKTARKGVGRFVLTVKGRAAHAGLNPEGGVSAILELSHVVQQLFALNDPTRGVTVNVGNIDGGMRPNVVAPESRAVVDVRVPDVPAARRIERAIHGLQPTTPGATLRIEGGIDRPPMELTPGNQALWRLAHDLGEHLGLDLDQGTAGGGSDGNFTSQYTATLDGLGAVGDGAHAEHEFIFVDRMVERAALLALLIAAPPLRLPPPGGSP